MTSPAFAQMATQTAGTKRPPALSDGKRGAPASTGLSLAITPLDPIDAEVRERFALEGGVVLMHCFHESDTQVDIQEKDILTIGSDEYPIKAVGEYEYDDYYFYEIIVEDIKHV